VGRRPDDEQARVRHIDAATAKVISVDHDSEIESDD
jgi:hypothetical protein